MYSETTTINIVPIPRIVNGEISFSKRLVYYRLYSMNMGSMRSYTTVIFQELADEHNASGALSKTIF